MFTGRCSQDVLKWYGWGYKDSQFFVDNGIIGFKGDKYVINLVVVCVCLRACVDTFFVVFAFLVYVMT